MLFKPLAKDPGNRFKSMGTFVGVLEKLSRQEVSQLEAMPLDEATLQGLNLTLPVSGYPTIKANMRTASAQPASSGSNSLKMLADCPDCDRDGSDSLLCFGWGFTGVTQSAQAHWGGRYGGVTEYICLARR